MPETLEQAAAAARACTLCADILPLGPRPVLRVSTTARLLIISQAPGTAVHATGISFNDPSGDRLRGWLQIDKDAFYDVSRVAIVGVGLCYPGRLANGGDAPPVPRCAPIWHPRLLPLMTNVRLTLLVGSYAIAAALGRGPMSGPCATTGNTCRGTCRCRIRPGAPPGGSAAIPGSPRRCCRNCVAACARCDPAL